MELTSEIYNLIKKIVQIRASNSMILKFIELEDVISECVVHILEKGHLSAYDPNKAELKTYLSKIIQFYIRTLSDEYFDPRTKSKLKNCLLSADAVHFDENIDIYQNSIDELKYYEDVDHQLKLREIIEAAKVYFTIGQLQCLLGAVDIRCGAKIDNMPKSTFHVRLKRAKAGFKNFLTTE